MDGGTYTLLLDRASGGTVTVGALGDLSLPAGYYAYTGSALGAGGFGRVERHRVVARGENDARHWHVDYLLGAAETRVDRAVTTSAGIECAVARRLTERENADAVDGFGCSDCDCRSHLHYGEDREELLSAVKRAHAAAD
ncbi:GIY-YIG nuclease family protein [Haloarcula nitratireducens]|uniref:GIY-YIG nuclease family protein n=1 Tax=Haloarcula nitratireducens TaxID=2487749 RepID=A0AAW4PEE9_9EURY|nr:GIY-YIG nuclease family protein [Halomicroarcula nitratireducens]MBX0295983.1 GIY-YIG nuclease family protein [Halomicroarcula nitratireducens]